MTRSNASEDHSEEYLPPVSASGDLYRLAFKTSLSPSVITTVKSGTIEVVNDALCKLLGYTETELLAKSRFDIFNIRERSFKVMLKRRSKDGHSRGLSIL